MRRVTQADIAKELGLSPSTVGLVVGNSNSPLRQHLNEDTVRRIEEKAKELGYKPNVAAQIMRRGRTNVIVFLNMGGLAQWVHRQAYEVGQLVHEMGYDYQVIDAYWWVSKGDQIIDQIIASRPEGVVLSGSPQADMDFERFRKAGVPLVSIDYEIPGFSWVRHDVRTAISTLVSASLAAGRERPALVILKRLYRDWQQRERLLGFTDALDAAGWSAPNEVDVRSLKKSRLRAGSAVVVNDDFPTIHFDPFRPGRVVAERLGTSVDALFCSNDDYATGALTHFLRNKVKVPDQVALSGFDNLFHTGEGIVPITTVQFRTEAMCRAAMKLLVSQIGGETSQAEELVFPCDVIWRESMPAPAAKNKKAVARGDESLPI